MVSVLRRLVPPSRLGAAALLASAVATWGSGCGAAGEPWLAEVVSFNPGEGAGFGDEELVLGPPRGAGEYSGSLDVLSLGAFGEIVAALGTDVVDGEGADLLVFENAFRFGQSGLFTEPGEVAVSDDGERWHTFPCAPDHGEEGCAGRALVFANVDDSPDIDPRDPDEAGGDAFDLADIGVARARFIRIRDVSGRGGDDGTAGFDLDAVAAVHTDFD